MQTISISKNINRHSRICICIRICIWATTNKPKTHPNQLHAFYKHKYEYISWLHLQLWLCLCLVTLAMVLPLVRPERQWQMVRQKYENSKYGLMWALDEWVGDVGVGVECRRVYWIRLPILAPGEIKQFSCRPHSSYEQLLSVSVSVVATSTVTVNEMKTTTNK